MSRNKKKHSNTASPQNTKASRSIVNTVNPKSNDLHLYILPFAILLITFFAFSPSLTCGFTNWDDPTYITKQDLLLHPGKEILKDIFTTNVSNNYHPLTMLSLKWNTNTTNLSAKPFHFTNVLLHLLNTLLVFIFIFLMSDKRVWIAAVVTLFFGIHPMHVESVTWIAERKDVLYSFFFLASLIAYFKFISDEKQKTTWYIFSFLLFTLSCLSKGVAVCLPIVLLLIDYYRERNFSWKTIAEKIPFFILSIVFGIIAFKAQVHESIASYETFTILQRIMFGTYGMCMFLIKFIFPINLSAFYPYPTLLAGGWLPWYFYVAPFMVIVLFTLLFFAFKNNMRTIVFGFLFFLFTIVLVLQFISVGMAIMADRYSYLPFIGLLFIICMLYEQWFEKTENTGASAIIKKTIPFITIVFALIFCVTTYARCKVWKDNQSLWTDVIKNYPEAAIAYKNRGVDLVENQQYDLALADFNSYLKIVRDDGSVYSNRANIYGLKHQYDSALADYSQAIALEKNKSSEAYLNRGITYSMMKIYDKAMLDYDKALSIEPRSIAVFQNRGYVLIEMKEYQKAIENFNQLIALTQNDFNAYFYRGLAYYNLSEYQKSIDDNTASIALNPSYGSAYQNRAICYNQLGNYKNALADALKAKELGAPLDAFIETLRSKQ